VSDTLDPIMQAAERLRRSRERPIGRGEPGYVERLCQETDDAEALAQWALSILPKGKRPVAIEKAGAEVWILNDLGQVFKATFPSADASAYWDGIRASIGEIGYATDAEAKIAQRLWQLGQMAATPLAS
jgi:hypothetical protein